MGLVGRWSVGVTLAGLCACGPADEDAATDDGDTTAAGTSSVSSASSESAGVGESSSGDSGAMDESGGGGACADVDGVCAPDPVDCDVLDCGGPWNAIDVDGCPGRKCASDDECNEGEACFDAFAFGRCIGSTVCFDDESGCHCYGDDGCGEKYCVSTERVPARTCSEITDEAECLAAGCTSLETVRPIGESNEGSCACGAAEPLCVWAPGPLTGTAAPMVYHREFESVVRVFTTTFDTPPYGWIACGGGDEFEPHECECLTEPGADPCAR